MEPFQCQPTCNNRKGAEICPGMCYSECVCKTGFYWDKKREGCISWRMCLMRTANRDDIEDILIENCFF